MINRNKSCIWTGLKILAKELDIRLIETRVVFEPFWPASLMISASRLIETRVVFEHSRAKNFLKTLILINRNKSCIWT